MNAKAVNAMQAVLAIGLILVIVAIILFLNAPETSALQQSQIVELENGSVFELSANKALIELGGKSFDGYAYNSQFPGPLLKVKQGTKIKILFKNNLNEPTTVHWHGIRMENRFDGVPEITQKEVFPNQSFEYELEFPDNGLFWYHPHVREDKQQELGLYGAILVQEAGEKTAREEVLILDDLLIENNSIPSFPENSANFAIMGRYGSEYLVNGKTDYSLNVKTGEIIRLHLLNASNARPLRIAIDNAKMKIVGGDTAMQEKEFFAESIDLSPSERAIIEVFFERAGTHSILNATPLGTKKFGEIIVEEGIVSLEQKNAFDSLKENALMKEELIKLQPFFGKEPDFEYELTLNWPSMDQMMGHMGHGMMSESIEGIEWEDSMQMMNSVTTSQQLTWVIRNTKTKKENMDFSFNAGKGETKKIRITNLENSPHPMQHSIHLHGNRFLVIAKNNALNSNLVWKDTVLIPEGETAYLLVEFSNPGKWMIHCHTAEHLSSGMMSLIEVA